MLNQLFDSVLSGGVTAGAFAACAAAALLLGALTAFAYTYKTRYTQSFVLTLALLPMIVQTVILLVNSNLGAGIAVGGAFSLVRFRSATGTAREIGSMFLAMVVGIACGMGYLLIAAIVAVAINVILFLYLKVGFGAAKTSEKQLRVTIPENLDYTELFDDLMDTYTSRHELIRVKTTNMGSLFQLTYLIRLKDAAKEKEFLDGIRCRNGNLEILCGRVETVRPEEL